MPIAERDAAIISATGDAHRAALLLSGTELVRKGISSAHVIQLCRRLVVPGAPAFAAIYGDDCALIRSQQNDLRVIRVDPLIFINVSTRRAAPAHPSFPAGR